MKKLVFLMVTVLFFVGCTDNSKNTQSISHNDLNSTTTTKAKEQSMIKFEEISTLGCGEHIKVKQIVKVGPNHSQYEHLKGKPVLATMRF